MQTYDEDEFWRRAMRGLPWFRCFRRSVGIAELDSQFQGSFIEKDWLELKAKLEPGDKIWPFLIHVRSYLGMRQGFLVVRRGKPVGGIVTMSS